MEPPKEWNVCCVTVVWRRCESRKVVRNAFPFHMICDWGVKPLPSAVSRTDSASFGMVSGESEVTWDCPTPWQLRNSALQVQPDDNRVRAATRAMRIERLAREERKLASLGRTWIGPGDCAYDNKKCWDYRKLLNVTGAAEPALSPRSHVPRN